MSLAGDTLRFVHAWGGVPLRASMERDVMEGNQMQTSTIELKVTNDERALLEAAASMSNLDVSSFVLEAVTPVAESLIRDQVTFTLSDEAWAAWEAINSAPAREVAGLNDLLMRRSPFGSK